MAQVCSNITGVLNGAQKLGTNVSQPRTGWRPRNAPLSLHGAALFIL